MIPKIITAKEVYQKHYEAFKNRTMDVNSISFGLGCGKGWYALIDELMTELDAISTAYRVTQIKEKFGGLRFYAEGLTDEQYSMINQYEYKSHFVCEECGSKDGFHFFEKNGRSGWYYTLCYPCIDIRLKHLREYRDLEIHRIKLESKNNVIHGSDGEKIILKKIEGGENIDEKWDELLT